MWYLLARGWIRWGLEWAEDNLDWAGKSVDQQPQICTSNEQGHNYLLLTLLGSYMFTSDRLPKTACLWRDDGRGGLRDELIMKSHSSFLHMPRTLLQLVLQLSHCIRERQRQETGTGRLCEKREPVCEYWPHCGPCVDTGGKKRTQLAQASRGEARFSFSRVSEKMGQASQVVNKNKWLDSRPGQLTISSRLRNMQRKEWGEQHREQR